MVIYENFKNKNILMSYRANNQRESDLYKQSSKVLPWKLAWNNSRKYDH